MKCVMVIIKGDVQGVFFRANMKKVADKLSVTGWVANVDDHVEAVLEGREKDIEAMIEYCNIGPRGAKVRSVSVTPLPHEQSFSSFEIHYD